MNTFKKIWPPYLGVVLGLLLLAVSVAGNTCERFLPGSTTDSTTVYVYRSNQSPDGTGKVYMGREIAAVTEHDPGAVWLERPEREETEFPNRVVEALEMRTDDVVADIGAGTGYFTFRISPHVPRGKVLAVDIQAEMLEQIRLRMEADSIANVEPILGTIDNPNLPDGAVDIILIVMSYHEFSHPHEMMEYIVQALRPGGRLVLVEYRGEDLTIPMEPLHKMTEEQVRREVEAHGLVWRQTKDVLPQQHFIVFEKPTR
ncbi:MAG: class I SAM-dependent methyltransferase [Rhodothermales bacterium]